MISLLPSFAVFKIPLKIPNKQLCTFKGVIPGEYPFCVGGGLASIDSRVYGCSHDIKNTLQTYIKKQTCRSPVQIFA